MRGLTGELPNGEVTRGLGAAKKKTERPTTKGNKGVGCY